MADKNILALEERVKSSISEIKVPVLKSVHKKCTSKYEGKYTSPLFYVNVNLDQNEILEVKKLIDVAKNILRIYPPIFPEYKILESYLEQMRAKLGTFGESERLIEDPNANRVSKTLIDGKIPGIIVPTQIHRLYTWSNSIDSVEKSLTDYQKGPEISKGRNAKSFGQEIKEVYRFIKESVQKLKL